MTESKKVNLDVDTKLRLLISLINDEGFNRIESSMSKLVTRIVENYETNYSSIREYLIRA
jgi:hypothetical protein